MQQSGEQLLLSVTNTVRIFKIQVTMESAYQTNECQNNPKELLLLELYNWKYAET